MRPRSPESPQTRRTGADYGVPPPLDHGLDAMASLRILAREVTATIGLRSSGKPGDQDLHRSRGVRFAEWVQRHQDESGVQPRGSVVASTFGTLSVAVLSARMEVLPSNSCSETWTAMGIVPADHR